ncbi:hypothetical protein GOODEAATRI_027949 [Goodea atripinnis]|uniref:DUF385 domain-containing protein n=1 Tax=Goodea atripinnis TaxID=208336 RepID=A0ABV0PSB6_9TELE
MCIWITFVGNLIPVPPKFLCSQHKHSTCWTASGPPRSTKYFVVFMDRIIMGIYSHGKNGFWFRNLRVTPERFEAGIRVYYKSEVIVLKPEKDALMWSNVSL